MVVVVVVVVLVVLVVVVVVVAIINSRRLPVGMPVTALTTSHLKESCHDAYEYPPPWTQQAFPTVTRTFATQ